MTRSLEVASVPSSMRRIDAEARPDAKAMADAEVILSFDVEEHFRIEAATGVVIAPGLRTHYRDRVGYVTRWLLDQLANRGIHATFFVLGQFAHDDPSLIRAIHDGGHEVASHGWDHRRLLELNPASFRRDLRESREVLEQATGAAVVGYRAPTFSIVQRTSWALDVLFEEGFLYDSSIFPVRHDRYGVPSAPRVPFLARGPAGGTILEFPPATLRLSAINLPVGGGGYFRLLPPSLLEWSLRQTRRIRPAVATLYFHPWEFDPDQPRLLLRRLSRFRTYLGMHRTRARLQSLLDRHRFHRAADVALKVLERSVNLAVFAF